MYSGSTAVTVNGIDANERTTPPAAALKLRRARGQRARGYVRGFERMVDTRDPYINTLLISCIVYTYRARAGNPIIADMPIWVLRRHGKLEEDFRLLGSEY